MFKLALINDKKYHSLLTANKKHMKIRAEKRYDKKVVWHFVNYATESVSQSLIPPTTLMLTKPLFERENSKVSFKNE